MVLIAKVFGFLFVANHKYQRLSFTFFLGKYLCSTVANSVFYHRGRDNVNGSACRLFNRNV